MADDEPSIGVDSATTVASAHFEPTNSPALVNVEVIDVQVGAAEGDV